MYRSYYLQLFVSLVALATVTLLWVIPAQAQFNEQINYQGRLLDATGSAVADGTYAMEFNLYTVATSGSAIWTETLTGANEVTVVDGLFSVMLGSTSPLTSVDFNQTLYLGVTIEADSEMVPRKILGAVPAAFVAKEAGNAETVGGVASSSFLRSDEADTMFASSSSSILTVIQNGLGKVASFFSGVTEVFTILNNGNVGIGTTTPSSRLAVAGNAVIGGDLTTTGTLSVGTLNGLLLGTSGTVSAVATSGLNIVIGDTIGTLAATRGGTGLTTVTQNQLLIGGAGNTWTQIGTSSLGLGNGTFLGLSDIPDTYTANRIFFTNSGATGLTDSANFTFDGTNLGLGGAQGIAWGGTRYLHASSTNDSIAFGENAGASFGATNLYNIALGFEAGRFASTTNASYNILTGYQAGLNLRGTSSILIGREAGRAMSGSQNIVLGNNSGIANNGTNNSFIGNNIGANLLGSANVAIGGNNFTNGSAFTVNNNVVIGYRAGFAIDGSSNNNILIGYQAADNLVFGANNIVIGYNIDAVTTSAANTLNIGNLIFGTGIDGTGTTLSTGNIGIGTTSPNSKLTVAGTALITGTTTLATTSLTAALYDGSNSAGTSGMVLQTFGTTTRWVATSTLGIAGGSGATTFLALTDTPSSYTANRLFFTNSGATAVTDSVNLTFDGSQLATLNLAVTGTSTFSGVTTLATTTIGSLSLTNALSATSGGTGLTSYSTGDLIYASGANTLANRTIGLTGNVLSVVGGVPTWVATSSLNIFGLSQFTDGGATTYLTALNENFGVGTTSSTSKLTIQGDSGSLNIFNVATSTGASVLKVMADSNVELSGRLIDVGVTWTARSAAGNDDSWNSVTYGNGIFVAISAGSDRLMTSSDGINWTVQTITGGNDNWNDVTYGNGMFVAVGSGSSDYIATSPDGINWTARAMVGSSSYKDIAYGNGMFVAVGNGPFQHILTSPDGIKWTASYAPGNNDGWNSVVYGNGMFVAVSSVGDRVMYSTNGTSWATTTAAGDNDSWQAVTYGNGQYVAVGDSGDDRIMTSPDGITWTSRSALGNDDTWAGVTYGNGLFVAVSGPVGIDRIATSPDGINWTSRYGSSRFSDVTYGNGMFVVVGYNGDRVVTSGYIRENKIATNNVTQDISSFVAGLNVGSSTTASSSSTGTLTIFGRADRNPFSVASSSGTNLLTLTSAGNFGLGSSSPSSLLTVAGTARITGTTTLATTSLTAALLDFTGSAGTNGMVLQSIGTSTRWVATSTLGISAGVSTFLSLTDTPSSYTANRVMFTNSGATALTDSANFTFDGTNLGLGNANGIGWGGNRVLYASTTLGNYFFGENAGTTVTGSNNIAIGTNALLNAVSISGNIAIGTNAGQSVTTGSDNVFIGGSFTGYSNTTGTDNIFIGYAAGGNNTTGSGNIIVGNSAGNALVSGEDNSVYGRFAALSLATSSYSTIVGHGAGWGISGAYQSDRLTLFGRNAGYSLQTGADNNILIGYNAADSLTTGANNIVIGYDIEAPSNTASNQLNIGNLIFGTGIDGTGTTLSTGNIGIGTTSPNSKLTVAGTFRATATSTLSTTTLTAALLDVGGSSGTNGMVLLSTGTSTRWAATSTLGITGGGGSSFLALTDTPSVYTANRIMYTNSVATGLTDSAGLTFDGTNLTLGTSTAVYWGAARTLHASTTKGNYIFGGSAGENITTGSNLIAIGSFALQTATSSINNIAIGDLAGQFNTNGTANVFIGPAFAGTNNTTGGQNVFLGYGAGTVNTTGSSNTLIGNSAGTSLSSGSDNTSLGAFAGNNLATSSKSILLGRGAGWGISGKYTANNLTLIGNNAGYNLQTGADNNILIGYQAADSLTTGANNIVIGYDIEAPSNTASNQLNIGNLIFGTGIDGTGTTLSTGNIGIGTTTPQARLSVGVNSFAAAGTAGFDAYYGFSNTASGTVQFGETRYLRNSGTATTTLVGNMIRLEDSSTLGNTVRGLEVQVNRGTNTQGENTALSGFARTFGVRGFTSGDAGARFEPAGGYFETGGTTQGNAIRGYSSTITSANLIALFQDTSTFTGTGLNIDLGNGTGSFTGKFVDLKVAGSSRFNVASTGTMFTIGDISITATNTDPAANNVVGQYFGANGFASINRSANPAMNLGRSNDGAVLQFYSAGAVQGSVSIAGATVSYNAFTGSHFGLVSTTTSYEKGILLELTGENGYYNDDPTSEIVYGMQKTTTENSSRVIGTYLASLEPSRPQSTANPTLVMAVGNGHMWVADQGEDIASGDYLISSNIAGHAEKDNSTSSVSYIIARASEDIDWSDVDEDVDGVKHKLITVFFENFTRPNVDFAMIASSTIGLEAVPEDSFTDSFLTGLFAKIGEWIGDAQNGISDIYANVFNAGERICVDGECLTADDIRNLKNALQGGGSSNPPVAPAGGGSGTGGDGMGDVGGTGGNSGTGDGGAGDGGIGGDGGDDVGGSGTGGDGMGDVGGTGGNSGTGDGGAGDGGTGGDGGGV
ncbi:MAG: hypothetical protein ACK4SL_00325 [Candidatus Paceibacteria bacterium]